MPHLLEACCLNCVFLYEELRDHKGSQPSLTQDVRDALREGYLPRPIELQCYQGIWGPEAAAEQLNESLAQWLRKDRDELCLFYPYIHNLFPAAGKHLEKRAANQREADKDRRWVKWGVWVAAAGLFLNLAWNVYTHFAPAESKLQPRPTHQQTPSQKPVLPSSP